MMQRICPRCWKMFPVTMERCPDDGNTLAVPEDRDLTGTRFHDKYDVVSLIGQGGMGYVYKAHQIRLNRPVAIKVLRSTLIRDETVVKRFINEAKASARLRSPNTIMLHDFDVSPDGSVYYEMELLEGRSLTSVIRDDTPVAVSVAAGYILQACDSLEEAHANGILHRDIKPDNLFLARVGDKEILKVLDFGIARMLENQGPKERLTGAGMVIGTPEYLSPEQAFGVDTVPASDLYSLALVFYELLTGHRPFQELTPVLTMAAHIRTPPPPLASWKLNLPRETELELFLRRALAKTPAARFPSVAEFRKALRVAAGLDAPGGTRTVQSASHRLRAMDPGSNWTPDPPRAAPQQPPPPASVPTPSHPMRPSVPTGTSREIPLPRSGVYPPTALDVPQEDWDGSVPTGPHTVPIGPPTVPISPAAQPTGRQRAQHSGSRFVAVLLLLVMAGAAAWLVGSILLRKSSIPLDSKGDLTQSSQQPPSLEHGATGSSRDSTTRAREARNVPRRSPGAARRSKPPADPAPPTGAEPGDDGSKAPPAADRPAPKKPKKKVGVKDIMAAASRTEDVEQKQGQADAAAPEGEESGEYARYIRSARSARQSRNYDRCIRQADRALTANPDSKEASALATECKERRALLSVPDGELPAIGE